MSINFDLYCTGQGTGPTVVLDAGLGESLVDWQMVQPVVATTHRACSFDRAGLGFSDRAPGTRDARTLARQMHDVVLHAAHVPDPYVLVGHSLAGLTARVYAHDYPAEVTGVVLVESAGPDDATLLPIEVQRQQDAQFAAADLCSGVSPLDRIRRFVGLDRLTASAPDIDPRLPVRWQRVAVAAQQRWLRGASPACEEGYREYEALSASDSEARAVTAVASPLAVVSRGLDETWPPPIPVATTERAWHTEQTAQLTLSSCSRQFLAPHARHYVMLDEPDVVVTAIRWALNPGC